MRFMLILMISLLLFLPAMAGPCGGVVECACGDTITNNYTMTSDLNCSAGGNGLTFGGSGIVLNCAGFSIFGDGSPGTDDSGVYNSGNDYISIRNCDIIGFSRGIYIKGTSVKSVKNNLLEGNVLHNNSYGSVKSYGVSFYYVEDSIVRDNAGFNNVYGLNLSHSDNNEILQNTFYNNSYGIWIQNSYENNLSFNNASENTYDGVFAWLGSDRNTFFMNIFWENGRDGIAISDTNPTTLETKTGCSGNMVDSNDMNRNTRHGIYMSGCSDTYLKNNEASFSGQDGIFMHLSTLSNISQNRFVNNSRYGLSYELSTSATESNTVCANNVSDFHVDRITNNSGYGNTCDNPDGWNDTGATNCTNPCLLGPGCDDGTSWGYCSLTKPKQCVDGILIYNCLICGCPPVRVCDSATGMCTTPEPAQETCDDGTQYSSCSLNSPLYCDNGTLRNDCTVCECPDGFTCNSTDSFCYPVCDDGTSHSHCSADMPKYCMNGTLVDACGSCGCESSEYCDATDNLCHLERADGSSCEEDFECMSNNCFNSICRSVGHRCDMDSECETDEYCSSGVCVTKNPVGGNCTSDRHCISGRCMDRNCVECLTSAECDVDMRCDDNVCVPIGINISMSDQLVVGTVLALVVLIAMAIFFFYTKRSG